MFAFFVVVNVRPSGSGAAIAGTYAVWGNFINTIATDGENPDVTQSTSATFFSGHVLTSSDSSGFAVEPTDGTYTLASSSFGQIVSREIPFPDFQDAVVERTKKMLYYESADKDSSSDFSKSKAAFRYKALLYGSDDVHAQFENMSDYWGDSERERAKEAADIIKGSLTYDPNNSELRNVLLDIFYDFAVAEMALANETLVKVEKYALGPEAGAPVPPDGEGTISNEIDLLHELLYEASSYDNELENYFSLLTDTMGVDMERVDPDATEMPFGYYIFKEEVPDRSLYASSYATDPDDEDSSLEPVLSDSEGNPALLFKGYKDLVLLVKLERDLARAAAKLAKLYALRGASGDMQSANSVIGDIQQKAYTEGIVINGIIEDLDAVDSQSGLKEAQGGWAQALSSLSSIKSFVDGEANPLGLDKNFLALVQRNLPNTDGDYTDTFSYFVKTLIPDGTNPTGALGNAYEKWQAAVNQYEKVETNKDTIAENLNSNRGKYESRLLEITGATSMDDPSYNTPEQNEGSEIYQQILNIETATLNIEKNQQEIENLNEQIEIEIERQGKESGINNLIAQAYVEYGNKQASLTEEIGYIRGWQEYNNNVQGISYLGSLNFVGVFMGLNNANLQASYEWDKIQLEVQKERYSAQQSADITYLNDQISAANSEAQVWVFMMARALEYKWNKEVVTDVSSNGREYSPSTVFSLRNANELKDMAIMLKEYNDKQNLGKRGGTQFVKFSLREDFLGYERYDEDNNKLYYADPLTGESVDAITAFKSYLSDTERHTAPTDDNMAKAFSEVVHIEFNTARHNLENTFFSTTRWNEKINYITVKINAQSSRSELQVWLEQSGTGYIRTEEGGTEDPYNPDQLTGEMTEHSIRFFRLDSDNSFK